MSKLSQIYEIIGFIAKHPESLASRHICRELLGTAVESINQELSCELETKLAKQDPSRIDAYYVLIR